MALQQIFTDIANAIRSKKGYNTKEEYPIYSYDMADEIDSIEQSGGGLSFNGTTSAVSETPAQANSNANIADFAFSATINTNITEGN